MMSAAKVTRVIHGKVDARSMVSYPPEQLALLLVQL